MPPDFTDKLKDSLVPPCPRGNDYGLTEKDFADYKSAIDDRLSELNRLVSSWVSCPSSMDELENLSLLVVLCGEHSTSSLWTTEVSLRQSREIYQSISSSFESAHSQEIFHDIRLIKSVLSLLRPKLLTTTFRCNPAATTCYAWFLKNIQHTILNDLLLDFLPTALIFADDYEPQNIKLGLESLHHIIDNVATEKLKWYGHDQVILDVLKKCLYLREPDIVSSHLKCFISLMKNSLQHNIYLKRLNFDEIVNNLLFNMYMEQKLILRRIYASNMADLISARGLGFVRHLSLFFKILTEYALESSTTKDALSALTRTVQVCWCRGDSVGENAMVILMKVLIVSSQKPSHVIHAEVSSEAQKLAMLVKEAFPVVVKHLLDKIRENRDTLDEHFLSLVTGIFNADEYKP